jgi:hypothetical protein
VPTNKLAEAPNALIPKAQRAYSTDWTAAPPTGDYMKAFIANVIQK